MTYTEDGFINNDTIISCCDGTISDPSECGEFVPGNTNTEGVQYCSNEVQGITDPNFKECLNSVQQADESEFSEGNMQAIEDIMRALNMGECESTAGGAEYSAGGAEVGILKIDGPSGGAGFTSSIGCETITAMFANTVAAQKALSCSINKSFQVDALDLSAVQNVVVNIGENGQCGALCANPVFFQQNDLINHPEFCSLTVGSEVEINLLKENNMSSTFEKDIQNTFTSALQKDLEQVAENTKEGAGATDQSDTVIEASNTIAEQLSKSGSFNENIKKNLNKIFVGNDLEVNINGTIWGGCDIQAKTLIDLEMRNTMSDMFDEVAKMDAWQDITEIIGQEVKRITKGYGADDDGDGGDSGGLLQIIGGLAMLGLIIYVGMKLNKANILIRVGYWVFVGIFVIFVGNAIYNIDSDILDFIGIDLKPIGGIVMGIGGLMILYAILIYITNKTKKGQKINKKYNNNKYVQKWRTAIQPAPVVAPVAPPPQAQRPPPPQAQYTVRPQTVVTRNMEDRAHLRRQSVADAKAAKNYADYMKSRS